MSISKTSYRENIAKNIVSELRELKSVRFVTREVFDPSELSDAQVPAVLVLSGSERKSDISRASRQGVVEFILTGFVKGKFLDTARNKLLDDIETKLYEDTKRNGFASDTVITEVNTDEGVSFPLGAVQIIVQVEYIHPKGDLDK
tara:strand:+ start:6472 stop:6906 length:435 start_codon:yes stop_codon:yes gene_type:complete